MELILRGSEYTSFLTCRKQWYHQWIEQIEPKRPDGKLFFGTLFHKWLEYYYKSNCNKLMADLDTDDWLNEQNMKDMQQTDIDDMQALYYGVSANYHKKYRESDRTWKILATELEFAVKLEGDIYYTGTIDIVMEIDGKIYFGDHKSVSSLDMYEEKSKMDRQISRYWWALEQLAAGVGQVNHPELGWIDWLEIKDRPIEGFLYNLIAKDFPKPPQVLAKGGLSKNKSQKTSYLLYVDKIFELNLEAADYEEMLYMLERKPDLFLRRVDVKRNDAEKQSAMWEFLYTANDIHDVKLLITEQPQMVDQITYRNIGTHCSHMCSFTSLCKTTIEGGNISLARNLSYRKREVTK